MRRMTMIAIACGLTLLMAVPAAAGGRPTIERQRFQDRYFDDFIFDLCGISTFTTQTQISSVKTFPDGREQVHVVRTFVPEDPRIPIEKGAATSFYTADGIQTVKGKPIQLFDPDGGVLILDAGLITFGDELIVRGPHPSLDADLADLYCPPGN